MNVSPQEQATLFILVPCGQTLHIHAMAARPLPLHAVALPNPMTVARRILSFGLSFRGQPVTTAARDPHQPGPDTRETVTDQGVFAYEISVGTVHPF